MLTEASSVEEARVALELGAKIIGINNRNLRTLEVDVNRAPNIASELTGDLPADVVLVAESRPQVLPLPEPSQQLRG